MNLRTLTPILLVAALATVPFVGTVAAENEPTADVTLRVAPTGFVVPSQHPFTQGAAGTSTPAVWLIDPVEDPSFNDEDGVAGCQLTATDTDDDGAIDGGEVLDQATDAGCITGWDYITFSCCGRFITMVDDLWKSNATAFETGYPTGWWQIQIDGHVSDVGIDDMNLTGEQDLSFVYRQG